MKLVFHLSRLSLWASILQSLPLVCGASRLPHSFCLMDRGMRKAFGPTKVVMLLAGSIKDVSMHWSSWKNRNKQKCYVFTSSFIYANMNSLNISCSQSSAGGTEENRDLFIDFIHIYVESLSNLNPSCYCLQHVTVLILLAKSLFVSQQLVFRVTVCWNISLLIQEWSKCKDLLSPLSLSPSLFFLSVNLCPFINFHPINLPLLCWKEAVV